MFKVTDIKKWKYYKLRLPNYPSIPRRIERVINERKERSNDNFFLKDMLDKISLNSFLKRVKNFEQQHLPTTGIKKFVVR